MNGLKRTALLVQLSLHVHTVSGREDQFHPLQSYQYREEHPFLINQDEFHNQAKKM